MEESYCIWKNRTGCGYRAESRVEAESKDEKLGAHGSTCEEGLVYLLIQSA